MKSKNLALFFTATLLFIMACMCSDTANIPTTDPTGVPQGSSSGIITEVVLAAGVEGEEVNPVNPTTIFNSNSTIHTVVNIKDAPVGTNFTAEFYVIDVGDAADPNSLFSSIDLPADGTRNLDFSLTPTASWPAGTYRVDILVNGVLDQSLEYTVQ
jgi:hypothetical protein